MIDRDGWSFVGGRFLEFEGNHNDTLIYAPFVVVGVHGGDRLAHDSDRAAPRSHRSTPRANDERHSS
ncbi:hypothetical protein OV203_31660 [Nannocystis sp. ILAH1]|uniref:hypothetical protein n=1 Tax=Nannocystis sp. ILAH1 TaxID=2996789 RepID=UPI002271FA8A|nr:hypothetical protein [Nannocystis sp. ILAH1]MCY0991742.1 hypothetical protein [Nannocystis sp. ILAH1]